MRTQIEKSRNILLKKARMNCNADEVGLDWSVTCKYSHLRKSSLVIGFGIDMFFLAALMASTVVFMPTFSER